MSHRPETWQAKEKEAAAESKNFHGQRLFSHYHPILKTASNGSDETMESTKSAVSQVTASPLKRTGIEKGKVPLLRFTSRGQEVVPNNENAATLTDLRDRLTDLEYEEDHSFLKSLSLLLEAWYFSVFLWFQMVWGGISRVVKCNFMIGYQIKKYAALAVQFLTGLLLAGLRLLMFGVTKGVAFD